MCTWGRSPGFTPRYWNLKRALGYANWLRNRRGAYQRAVLDRIVADLKAQAPDHIAVTGDLVNIGLPQEHINALAWLESVGAPEGVTVIPGNHDIYSRLRRRSRHGALGALHGVGRARALRMPAQRRGLSVRAHAGPGGARSASTRRCRRRRSSPRAASARRSSRGSARLLERLGGAGIFRLVLIHHPPLPGQAKRFAVCEDAAAAGGGTVAAWGRARHPWPQPSQHAGLVRHGAAGTVPVVGAPSASLGRHAQGASRSPATTSTASPARRGRSSLSAAACSTRAGRSWSWSGGCFGSLSRSL